MTASTKEMLAFLHDLYRRQTVADLSETICLRLPGLIGGENAIICRHDGSRRIITSVVAKHPFSRANLMPHINESGIMAMHPFWDTIFDPHEPARALSDIISRKAWHAHPLYNEVFAPDGIEDQMNMEIVGDPASFVTVNVLRGRRGFNDRDKSLFAQLHPHLAQAFENAALFEAAGLVTDQDAAPIWRIPLDEYGRIATTGDELRPSLERQFGRGGRLPEEVEQWLIHQVQRMNEGWMDTRLAPLTIRHHGDTWSFTLYRDFNGNRYSLSVRRDSRPSQEKPISTREADIFEWVAEGKSNEEIALILGVSVNTVKTHLKRGFLKLGVENRTAAALTWKRRCHANR
ncbi:MAG TPA: helix-turn-helix transcriptional regulator [Kiritimatiellia bacterium]|nr:helix-turn-helix transcriptional regulator [Kiritimatiellia bacterium]HMO99485.1 helix-turn-helix transcriptional regulator [Kiritimatiellia bacterium]HMP97525.1 helix-turn-helix transcriptional regulator [Kiritimatiellia bacterium]